MDLTQYIRPGDLVAWPQGAGEPLQLTSALVEQRHRLPGLRVFVGTLLSETLTPDTCEGVEVLGVGGLAKSSMLSRAGLMEIMPIRMTAVPRMLEAGQLRVDVALLHLAGPDDQGRYSMACTADYVRELIGAARTVVAEVNDRAPFTLGDTLIDASDIDATLPVSYEPIQVAPSPAAPGSPTDAVAHAIAELVPDGATLQTGIGSIVDAFPAHLRDKNDLGIHSGVISDATLSLIEAGVVTNSRKEIDQGLTVTGALFGTQALYDWADRRPDVVLRPLAYTHDASVLARLASFYAVNGAVEVDLSGQINSEMVGGRHVGAVGGQLDFANAAMASKRGRSIVGLSSTASGGSISRITTRLADGVTSTARADADLIVTEYGIADLRGATVRQRRERLIAIAHPDHRAELSR